MYCPECGSEFREGIVRCPDCEVDLTTEQPLVEQGSPEDLVDVFDTSDVSLLPVVKSVLEAAGIPFFVQGDEALGVLPVGRVGVGGFSAEGHGLAATILVPRSRAEEVRELLDALPQSSNEPEESEP